MKQGKTGKIKFTGKRVLICLMLAAVLFASLPMAGFAAARFELKKLGTHIIKAGSSEYVTFTAKAPDLTPYMLLLEPADADLVVVSGSTGVISSTELQTVTYQIKALRGAKAGGHGITFKAVDPEDPGTVYAKVYYTFTVQANRGDTSSMSNVGLDVSFDVDGEDHFTAGKTQLLRIYVYNRGSVGLSDAKVQVSFPQGVSIESGSVSKNIGYFTAGKTATAEYYVKVEDDVKTGSYSFGLTLSGTRLGNSESYTDTFYVPVAGTDGSAAASDTEVVNIEIPEKVNYNTDFTLSFGVRNNAGSDAENLLVTVSIPEGVSNSTKNVFTVKKLAKGEVLSFTVKMRALEDIAGKYALIAISVSDSKESVTQYTGVMVNEKPEEEDKKETSPILMVSAYSYGDEPVVAGEEFDLSLTLLNTNKVRSLRNIKVTVDSGGTFLPLGSSTSFYIERIKTGEKAGRTIHMSCLGDAEQAPRTVNINMSYEDYDGNQYTASDAISVPVIQKIRFSVDEILDPGWLTAGSQGYLSVNYYNLGRNQLYNLRIKVEGDFTVEGSPSYYVGNLLPGKSDYYSVNFWPNQEGPMNGTVRFTFEDASGREYTVDKNFTFNIGEAFVYEEPMMPMEEENPKKPWWVWAAIGAGVLLAVFITVKIIKKRKAKKQEALELDD